MAKKKESKPNIFKTISSIFSYVALVVLVLIASFLIFYIVSNLIAKLTHKKPVLTLYTIVSPSMEPYIMVYDVIVDTRVLSEDSLKEESHTSNLLEYPQYTKPYDFRGRLVPEVLISGHHKKIAEYRKQESIRITKKFRPDLLDKNN